MSRLSAARCRSGPRWHGKANADRQARLAGRSPQGPRYAGDEAIDIGIERDDGIVIVNVTGRMDSVSAQSFHRETGPLVEDASRGVVLNLTDLTFMSSGGLRVTLLLARQLSARRSTLVMYGLSEMVREVYAISGFDRFPQHRGEPRGGDGDGRGGGVLPGPRRGGSQAARHCPMRG